MVSIIVPIYNAEKFLEETVRSVLSQSFEDWELILIDDGSTDGSASLADNLARLSSKIKVVHKTNGGLSSARNTGLDAAMGNLIFFLDADDLLAYNSLERMVEIKEKSGANIVSGVIHKFKSPYIPKIKDNNSGKDKFLVVSGWTACRHALYQTKIHSLRIDNSMCGKLFSAHLWNNIRFRENTYYEDLDIFYHLFLNAQKIAICSFITYLYRQHPSSYIHTFTLSRKDMLEVTRRLTEFITSQHSDLSGAALSRQLSANFNMLSLLFAHSRQLKKEKDIVQEMAAIEKYCWDNIKSLRGKVVRDPEVRIKNKVGIFISYLGGRPLLRFMAPIFYR